MPPKRTNKKLAKEHDLDETDVQQAREAFDLVASEIPATTAASSSSSAKATIPISAVRSALIALGLHATPQELKSITSHLKALVAASQDVASGVTFEMFLEVVAVKTSDRDKSSEVDRAFELFDPGNTGRITINDLRRIAKSLGEDKIKDEELFDMLQEAGDGAGINKSQFEQVMGRAGMW